jgi:hypothetical protein
MKKNSQRFHNSLNPIKKVHIYFMPAHQERKEAKEKKIKEA